MAGQIRSRLFIGGEWVAPTTDKRIEVVSPTTEQVFATVPEASEADVDRVVGAAREAFDHGPWPRTRLDERLAVLRRLSEDMAAHHDEMADVVTDEMGCPITQSRTMQVTSARAILDSYLELAANFIGRVRTTPVCRCRVSRCPSGRPSR